ncbi:AaceriAGR195Wp [Anopheles sinensis]|uniref:AaceriAGR195Wp n=1 Tax=Anopheles sinensis TaxID=74873 RepID=A0A084VZ35_ANOSI|nr:AaceriAGR195Wp [Anopheles sinensis]
MGQGFEGNDAKESDQVIAGSRKIVEVGASGLGSLSVVPTSGEDGDQPAKKKGVK